MFTRCWKQDQWDWCAVYTALGAPDFNVSREVSILLGVLGACIRCQRLSIARHVLQRLHDFDLEERIDSALASISETVPRLAIPRRIRTQSRGRVAKNTTASVHVQYQKAKLDEANRTHAELLALLRSHLSEYGHLIESNELIDAYARLRTGPAIFEAKSITDDNEVSQIRQGLSQLYEYRFRHRIKDATLWLLLSRAPSGKLEWMTEYIEKDRDVRLLWIENGSLSGPSFGRLTESGSTAIRRDNAGNHK